MTGPLEGPSLLRCARCARPGRLSRQPIPTTAEGRVVVLTRRFPEGRICSGCYAKACETYGRCEACGEHRLTPGIGPQGQRWCTDCAGGLGDFTCPRCGQEGWLHRDGQCARCLLTDQLRELLDDGAGQVRAELVPLLESIRVMSRPRSGLLWLSRPQAPAILTALARGQVPLTHEGLSTLSPKRSVIYVRDLLIACGTLPPIDRFLFLFEQWLPGWLEAITDEQQRSLLRQFATWDVLRKLRRAAAKGPVGHYRNQNAREHLRKAAGFLEDLQRHGRTLPTCTQADLDRWTAGASFSQRQALRPFLKWATARGHLPPLRLPTGVAIERTPISQRQRIELIRRVRTDPAMTGGDRVLALLVLLYAQPLNKIAQMSIDAVIRDGDEVLLRLGDPATPVPAPFGQFFTDHVARRSNLTTATNPDSTFLFPGRRAGQPIHPTSLRLRLQQLGIPNLDGRTRAIRELLMRAPAPVVAGMLGYADASTEQLAARSGATYKNYASGEHDSRRMPRLPAR